MKYSYNYTEDGKRSSVVYEYYKEGTSGVYKYREIRYTYIPSFESEIIYYNEAGDEI